jgi:hypothetical protein
MITLRNLWMCLLPLAILPLTDSSQAAPFDQLPVKVDMSLQWNIRLNTPPPGCSPCVPWYLYFPLDPTLQSPRTSAMYPNWPTPQERQQKTATQTSVSNYCQPVSFQAPSYWYRK